MTQYYTGVSYRMMLKLDTEYNWNMTKNFTNARYIMILMYDTR